MLPELSACRAPLSIGTFPPSENAPFPIDQAAFELLIKPAAASL